MFYLPSCEFWIPLYMADAHKYVPIGFLLKLDLLLSKKISVPSLIQIAQLPRYAKRLLSFSFINPLTRGAPCTLFRKNPHLKGLFAK